MLILNCGGTFNKCYNPIKGELEVPFDNNAVEEILKNSNEKHSLAGVVYKDSLEMNVDDRKMLADIIRESIEKKVVVIHGTDTMHLTAEFFDEVFNEKIIILTGAMKPYEIDNNEASFNLGMALGFAKSISTSGVYICMNGLVELFDKIKKNRDIGKFELVR